VQKESASGSIKPTNLVDANVNATDIQTDEAATEQIPPIKKEEIIKKLRGLKLPITYFGETDWQRYERLKKATDERLDEGLKHDGNTFYKDLTLGDREFKNMVDVADEKLEEEKIEKIFDKRQKYKEELEAMDTRVRKRIGFAVNVTRDEKYDDVYYFIRRILRDWEREIEQRTEDEKNSIEGKGALGIYRQARRNIKPLLELLKEKKLNDDILSNLFHISHLCILGEYVKAHDKYLELAIGNAPWPMGVTMVGIHERSGRSKIFSSQVAHILNDETQRKYLQSIKRCMTLCQKYYPSEYAKNVNN
jgi:pre-mRNA-splicing factor 18